MNTQSITETIAEGLDESFGGDGFTVDHLRAMRLADASPALLAACRAALVLILDPDATADDAEALEKLLRGAIAKAEGIE